MVQNTARALKIPMEIGRCASTLLLLTSNTSKSQKDQSSSDLSLSLRSWCRGKVSHHQGRRLYSWKCLEILYEGPAKVYLWLGGEVFKNVALCSVVLAWLRGVKGLRQCWGRYWRLFSVEKAVLFSWFFLLLNYLVLSFELFLCTPNSLLWRSRGISVTFFSEGLKEINSVDIFFVIFRFDQPWFFLPLN